MKINKKCLVCVSPLLFLLLTSFVSKAIDPNVPDFVITSSIYGPFTGDEGNKSIAFKYTYNGNATNLSFREGFMYYADGHRVYINNTSYHTVTKGTATTSIKLPFNTSLLKEYGYINLVFYIENSNGILYEKEFFVYKKQSLEINAADYYPSYRTLTTTFNVAAGTSYYEQYTFSSLNDVLCDGTYYEIDLSKKKITYAYESKFTYDSCFLIFKDPYNLFPYIIEDRITGDKSISLKITQKSKTLSFSFNTLYYYDKTMDISTVKGFGMDILPSTSHLYLPLKKKDQVDGMEFTLRINKAGVNQTDIFYKMYVDAGNNLFGDCNTSDYCISGEEA